MRSSELLLRFKGFTPSKNYHTALESYLANLGDSPLSIGRILEAKLAERSGVGGVYRKLLQLLIEQDLFSVVLENDLVPKKRFDSPIVIQYLEQTGLSGELHIKSLINRFMETYRTVGGIHIEKFLEARSRQRGMQRHYFPYIERFVEYLLEGQQEGELDSGIPTLELHDILRDCKSYRANHFKPVEAELLLTNEQIQYLQDTLSLQAATLFALVWAGLKEVEIRPLTVEQARALQLPAVEKYLDTARPRSRRELLFPAYERKYLTQMCAEIGVLLNLPRMDMSILRDIQSRLQTTKPA